LESTSNPLEIVPETTRPVPSVQARLTTNLSEFPWWILGVFLFGAVLIYNFITDDIYQDALSVVVIGLRLTITITISSYLIAIVLGLITALGQLSTNVIARNLALFYVQVVRGIPIIVQIFIVALVIVPLGVDILNSFGDWLASIGFLVADNPLSSLSIRDISFVLRGIIALAISYGAFSSEVFRAGIQSIEKGQIEAANSLGLNRFQSLRLVILPQAIRRVLPPLGNDFIAMLKESALLSVIGVGEMTQESRKHAAATFRFPQTYYTLAFLYLSVTLILSMGVKFMESRLKTG
jgi:polar amino acid transport system permease protein